MAQVDWSSLHKILRDTTRRSILELLKEKEALTYTEMMVLLRITNTGRLNYHIKALNGLISKDDTGKYRLTERGKLAVNLLTTFPDKVQLDKKKQIIKIVTVSLMIIIGVALIVTSFSIVFFSAVSNDASTLNEMFPSRCIHQNTTLFLSDLVVNHNDAQLNLQWSATDAVNIYLLNSTQYGALLVQHSDSSYLSNFTGSPPAYINRYYLQNGSSSLELNQGRYWLFTGSTDEVTLNSLSLVLQQGANDNSAIIKRLLADFIPAVIGIILLAFAILVQKNRIWR